MIGYYVHHVGTGHLNRARALDAVLDGGLTGLSSLPAPEGWIGDWVELPRDDDPRPGPGSRTDAAGRLHWAPLRHEGLLRRMAAVAAWIERARPRALVCDVSVEVLTLARLHGVPVVGVVLPGRRDDAAHRLGFDLADSLVAFWPPEADGLLRGVPDGVRTRVQALGALPAVPTGHGSPPAPGGTRPRVVLMLGRGGHSVTPDDVAAARRATPDWDWTVLADGLGTWHPDPAAVLADADVVVTHAGQAALATVAACRRPALIFPQARPYAEQHTTAAVLHAGAWPALAVGSWPCQDWPSWLATVSALDGDAWEGWCDGSAVDRFADVVLATAQVPDR